MTSDMSMTLFNSSKPTEFKTKKESENSTAEILDARFALLLTSDSPTVVSEDYKPKDDDVILATASKAGTTWLSNMLHCLRSSGEVSYGDIDVVVPFLEYFYSYMDGDLNSNQTIFPPRIFKTHLMHEDIPSGAGKYVVVVRDPLDAFLSLYYFYRNWIFEDDEISLEGFAEWGVKSGWEKRGQLHVNLSFIGSYYAHRLDDNVLWLHFEDLKEDLPQCVRLVSDFLEIGVGDEALLKLAEEQSSLAFMKSVSTKFDGHTMKHARNHTIGLPRDYGLINNTGRVRNGRTNEGMEKFSESTKQQVALLWKRFVEPATGCASYAELRTSINEEQGRNFGLT